MFEMICSSANLCCALSVELILSQRGYRQLGQAGIRRQQVGGERSGDRDLPVYAGVADLGMPAQHQQRGQFAATQHRYQTCAGAAQLPGKIIHQQIHQRLRQARAGRARQVCQISQQDGGAIREMGFKPVSANDFRNLWNTSSWTFQSGNFGSEARTIDEFQLMRLRLFQQDSSRVRRWIQRHRQRRGNRLWGFCPADCLAGLEKQAELSGWRLADGCQTRRGGFRAGKLAGFGFFRVRRGRRGARAAIARAITSAIFCSSVSERDENGLKGCPFESLALRLEIRSSTPRVWPPHRIGMAASR